MLNIAMRAKPNRVVTCTKVVTVLFASRPFALVLLILIFGPRNPNTTIVVMSMLGSNSKHMPIVLGPCLSRINQQSTRLEILIVNELPSKLMTKRKQLGDNLGVLGLEDEVPDDKVSIDLGDGQKK